MVDLVQVLIMVGHLPKWLVISAAALELSVFIIRAPGEDRPPSVQKKEKQTPSVTKIHVPLDLAMTKRTARPGRKGKRKNEKEKSKIKNQKNQKKGNEYEKGKVWGHHFETQRLPPSCMSTANIDSTHIARNARGTAGHSSGCRSQLAGSSAGDDSCGHPLAPIGPSWGAMGPRWIPL
jgi:hypothetical protein